MTAASEGELVSGAPSSTAAKPDGADILLIGDLPAAQPSERELRDYGFLFLAAILVAGAVVFFARVPVTYAAGGLVGLAYLILCARRPVMGCALLALATPLVEGLGRGTVVPLVRPSEAMLALLIVGVLVHEIPRRQVRNYTVLDLAVIAYAVGASIIPALYLLLTGGTVDNTSLFNIFAPLQYLAIYLLFSRVQVTDRDRRLFLNLAMASSVIVSLIGIAQLANVPGLQDFLYAHYPIEGEGTSLCLYGVCRPSSLLQHYSALGAYAALSYTVALALLVTRRAGFDARWLVCVLAVNAMGVFVSQTVAAVVGLVLATVIVLIYRRTFPRQLLLVGLAVAIGTVLFWNSIASRIEQQFPVGNQSVAGIPVPESMEVREQYWGQLFWPALEPVIWTGSGNMAPSVPASLQDYVDNEYLGMGFRAGIGGEVLLLGMLTAIAVMGWRARRSQEPLEVALGSMTVAYVVVLAVMGTTAEYLGFAGVDQAFWMVIGMLAGYRVVSSGRTAPTSQAYREDPHRAQRPVGSS